MLELQVPLLAAKALLLLLLFAFIYAVVRRGVGDLRQVPDDEPFEPGREGRGAYAPLPSRPGSKGSSSGTCRRSPTPLRTTA